MLVVDFQSTEDPLQSLNKEVLKELLRDLCRRAATELKSEIVRQLDQQFTDFYVSDSLKKRIPLLKDVLTFYRTLLMAYRVVEVEDGYVVEVDTSLLASVGIPTDFPVQLEYGSPNVATVAHWRPAIEKMSREIAARLAEEEIAHV